MKNKNIIEIVSLNFKSDISLPSFNSGGIIGIFLPL